MITSIEGVLTDVTPLRAVLEINGLGYEVNVPTTTAERLPVPGVRSKLHTVVIYREDSQTLYGFATSAERDFFRLLIENVTGVGPKSALTIMSRLSLPSLEGAIRSGDIATLARCPGIGKKTAERLVVELKSKVGGTFVPRNDSEVAAPTGAVPSTGQAQRDAVSALVALGYKSVDADQAVRIANLVLGERATTERLIKKALSG